MSVAPWVVDVELRLAIIDAINSAAEFDDGVMISHEAFDTLKEAVSHDDHSLPSRYFAGQQ